jgi:GxxExxY protein
MLEETGKQIIDSALRVHRELGPGLLENAYLGCLDFELRQRGLEVECQKPLALEYRGHDMGIGYRLDLLVNGCVVVELKAVREMTALHEAQLLSYLKLGSFKLGYLLNFNVRRMKDGMRRMVNCL